MTTLPSADWHQRASLQAVIAVLGGPENTRYVGGAVRDTLLGITVKDIDLATKLKPDDVMARLKKAAIKVVPTGVQHGTVTAVTSDGPVEITTLRRDVSTDGRRATVAFSDDWKEDAARRDFTINALSADPETLEVFDYFDGLDDLKARQVRFIGSAKDRIAEDHLRIMRYFRFIAKIGNHAVDEEAYQACQRAARELEKLSRERIADELMKLLGADNPLYAIEEMIYGDIFAYVLAEIGEDAVLVLSPLMGREKKHDIAPDPVRRLAGLLPKDTDKARKITKGLRFSKKLQQAVAARLTDETPLPETIRALAYRTSVEAARDIALLFGEDDNLPDMLERLEDWEAPIFPLTGGDLIAMGMEAGPAVSATLSKIERAWIEGGFPDHAGVQEMAQAFFPSNSMLP